MRARLKRCGLRYRLCAIVEIVLILITGPKQSQTEFDPPYYQLTILKKELLSMQGIHENASSLVNNYHIAVHFVLSENWFQISTCRPVP